MLYCVFQHQLHDEMERYMAYLREEEEREKQRDIDLERALQHEVRNIVRKLLVNCREGELLEMVCLLCVCFSPSKHVFCVDCCKREPCTAAVAAAFTRHKSQLLTVHRAR